MRQSHVFHHIRLLVLIVSFFQLWCTQKIKKNVFRKPIAELNFLARNEITLNINGVQIVVKFPLVLILKYNLGLNGILGFIESFKANYFCRKCKVHTDESLRLTIESDFLLRTPKNYEAGVKTNKVSDTGVKEPCVFHEVNGFHVTQNVTVDIIHDLLEGVCMYDMKEIIFVFIFGRKYFTLQSLNLRIEHMNFGPTENSNKPPNISLDRLKSKVNCKVSASKMLRFVR